MAGCQNKKVETLNSPLATVIKLNAAETLMDFAEAKKYQDINKIYGKYSESNKATPEDVWKEKVTFSYNLAKDKKFTNQWEYYDYDIIERIDNIYAEVIFKSKNSGESLQGITYKLELRQSNWIVNDIEYKKK
jgi:hypothetical protein